jgi:hypothetical protein
VIYDGSLRALISIVFVAAACSPTEKVRVDLPIGSDHRSLVLAVEDGGELSVYAFDLERDGPILQTLIPSYIGSYAVNLTAFLYSRELDALGFEAGTVLPANSDPVRPIPSATSTMTATVRGEDVSEWTPIARPSDAVMSFRVPGLANEECVERGGCFGATSAACIVPCPEVPAPAPAEMPAIPTASCAPGWADLEVKPGVAVCTPWPGAPPACNGDQTIFPGESTCHALGPGCPVGPWPTALPAGPRIYVRAGATGGDGSENAPLGAIEAAIGQAAAGAVIVIGAGTYPEEVRINKSVTLFGACPEMTTIAATGVAVVAAAPNVSVQNLRITATDDGVHFETGSLLRLNDVIIENTGGEGIAIFNASTAELDRVLIRHTDDTGIWVQGRGVVTGSRVHIYDARGGVGADRSRMTLVDSVIRDSRPDADGDFGRGANVQNDATAIFRRTIFDNHHDIGIFVSTANAELDRVVIQRTKVRPIDDGAGFGLLVQNEGVATIRNSWLDENHDSNLYNFNGVATFEDSVLSHARVTPNGNGGFNVHNIANGSVTLRRVVAIDSEFNNINLSNSRFAQLEDVSVLGAGIHPQNRDSANGIDIHGTASPVLARVYIADVAAKAIDLGDASSSANLSDITIRRAGYGDCFFCSGLCLANGVQVTNAQRIDISDVLGVGVYTQDQGTKLIISDIAVTKTKRSAACVLNHNVRDVGHGVGIYSADGATIEGRNFLSAENEESGVQVAEFLPTSMDTALDLSSGTIRDNAIGATVLIEGYDTRRIAKFVVFSNNDTNLNYGQ